MSLWLRVCKGQCRNVPLLASIGDAGRQARRPTLAASGALLFDALFFGGGISTAASSGSARSAFSPSPSPLRSGRCPSRGAGAAAFCLFGALTAWVGLTMWWSIAPDLSWARLRPDARLRRVRASGWSPARAAAGADGRRRARRARRARPLLGAPRQGDPVALPGRRARRPAAEPGRLLEFARGRRGDGDPARTVAAAPAATVGGRGSGRVLVYVAELVVVLTYSRAGIAVALLAAGAWLALTATGWRPRHARRRHAGRRRSSRSGRSHGRRSPTTSSRTRAGSTTARGSASSSASGPRSWPWRVVRRAGRALRRSGGAALRGGSALVVGVGALAAVVVVLALKGGAVLDEFRGSKAEVTQSPNRLADLSSSNRWTWWKEAWQLCRRRPPAARAPATFELARRKIRDGSIVTTEPHDLPLQFLAETGIVGFLLLLGLIGAGAGRGRSARCGRSRRASARAAGGARDRRSGRSRCTRWSRSTGSSSPSRRPRSSCSASSSASAPGGRRGRRGPSPCGDRGRRRCALLPDRAVRVEPPRRLGVQRDRPRRVRAGALGRPLGALAEPARDRPALALGDAESARPRRRRRRSPRYRQAVAAPAGELEHVVRARLVRVLHRALPRRAARPRPRLRPRPVRPGGAAGRAARPGAGEGARAR